MANTSSLSIEIGKPQIPEESIVCETTPPPSTTICALSATFITEMDALCQDPLHLYPEI